MHQTLEIVHKMYSTDLAFLFYVTAFVQYLLVVATVLQLVFGYFLNAHLKPLLQFIQQKKVIHYYDCVHYSFIKF